MHETGGNVAARRGFGSIRRLPSKKYQVSYVGPDGRRHTAPTTFASKMDAEGWLVGERSLIERDTWVPPPYREQARLDAAAAAEAEREAESITVTAFIREWLPSIELRPTTRRDYESLLRNHVAPSLDEVSLRDLTKASVKRWWEALDPEKPRARSKAFQFLHTAMNAAVELDLLAINPVTLPRRTRVRTKTARRIQPLSMMELEALADAMPTHLRMAVLIGGWCGLRYGELAELRRRDMDTRAGTIRVERGVVKVAGGYQVGPPKTEAGERTVHLPASLLGELRQHLRESTRPESDALLFGAPNGGHMHSSVFARAFTKAAESIGRPDATPHVLRHTHASLAADISAPTPVTMRRLGHTTASMTMRYTHAMADADQRLAVELDAVRTTGSHV